MNDYKDGLLVPLLLAVVIICIVFVYATTHSYEKEIEFCNLQGDLFTKTYEENKVTQYNGDNSKALVHCDHANYKVGIYTLCSKFNYFGECIENQTAWVRE